MCESVDENWGAGGAGKGTVVSLILLLGARLIKKNWVGSTDDDLICSGDDSASMPVFSFLFLPYVLQPFDAPFLDWHLRCWVSVPPILHALVLDALSVPYYSTIVSKLSLVNGERGLASTSIAGGELCIVV